MRDDTFFQSRIPRILRPPVFSDEEKSRTASLINIILIATLATDLVFPIILTVVNSAHDPIINIVFLIVGVVLVGLSFLLRRGQVELVAVLFSTTFLLTFSFLILSFEGIRDASVTGFYFLIVMTSLITSRRVMLSFTLLSIVVFISAYIAEVSGLITTAYDTRPDVIHVVMVVLSFSLTAIMLQISVRRLIEAFEQAHANERALGDTNQELQNSRMTLAVRTKELERLSLELETKNDELTSTLEQSQRRAQLLQASAEISRAIARIRNMDSLLFQVTRLISQHFGYYHVGIFLIDESGLNAVLKAANSEGGQRMLQRNHKLGVGTAGIVGFVTGSGRTRVAYRTGTDLTYFDNPDLPETRSEAAIPLQVEGRTTGALDVQSTKPDDFEQEDIAILTALADQIAITIENTNLLERAEITLRDAEAAQRRYVRDEWDSFLGRPAIPATPGTRPPKLEPESKEAQS